MFQWPTKCPGSLWYWSSSYVPLDWTYWNFIEEMAFTCLIVCTMHAGMDGLHLMEAACEKVYLLVYLLPFFDVLYLKEKQLVHEFLQLLEITLSLIPRLVVFQKSGAVSAQPASWETGKVSSDLMYPVAVMFFAYIWTLNLNILNL